MEFLYNLTTINKVIVRVKTVADNTIIGILWDLKNFWIFLTFESYTLGS